MTVTSDPAVFDGTTDDQYWLAIQQVTADLERHADLDRLCELAATHPEWPVRAACVRILGARFADREAAQRAIAAATHDTVDSVAFTAITVRVSTGSRWPPAT